LKIKKE